MLQDWTRVFNGSRDTLREVYLESAKLVNVPHAITLLSRLEVLSLSNCEISDLPNGPYLANLKYLDASFNRFSNIPPALGAAHQLQVLLIENCNRLTPTLDCIGEYLISPSQKSRALRRWRLLHQFPWPTMHRTSKVFITEVTASVAQERALWKIQLAIRELVVQAIPSPSAYVDAKFKQSVAMQDARLICKKDQNLRRQVEGS